MASQGTPATPGGASAPPAGSPQALNQIVIEYLSKKGYSKTEAMLRVESAHTDHEGRPIFSNLDDQPEIRCEKAYCKKPSAAASEASCSESIADSGCGGSSSKTLD